MKDLTCPEIDGVPIESLMRENGSPLYVFSELWLRRSFHEMSAAFKNTYPQVHIAWSYKTNYLRAICAIFHDEGAWAEVASDFEYEKACAIGLPGSMIIINGPYQPRTLLQRAVADGAHVQIDNFDGMDLLSQIAKDQGRIVEVGIRVHVGNWSKFGFDADTSAAANAIDRVRQSPYLHLTGLHTHIGTAILDPNLYRSAARRLVAIAAPHADAIRRMNLGGGFVSRSYFNTGGHRPDMNDYAQAITEPIREGWPKDRPLPGLLLESGRALVDEAGFLLTTVVARKPDLAAVVVDAGVNLLSGEPTRTYQFRAEHAHAEPQPQTVFGPLCMPADVLGHHVPLPPLQPDDRLVIHPVGAYCITQSMQFITYRPRVVMIMADGSVRLIRERETLQHIEALERMPPMLSINPQA